MLDRAESDIQKKKKKKKEIRVLHRSWCRRPDEDGGVVLDPRGLGGFPSAHGHGGDQPHADHGRAPVVHHQAQGLRQATLVQLALK